MGNLQNRFAPAGRLVPVFGAHEGLDTSALANGLAKCASRRGETVLMIDICGGDLMREAGIIYNVTLGDVLYRGANIRDAKYVSFNEHYTVACAGDADMEALLGSMAALSLGYDWVFVVCETGCTPAHVRLAAAADTSILAFESCSDQFMRAYWMLDAIRARAPMFDPMMTVFGDEDQGFDSFDLFAATVRDFLGAPPALGALVENRDAVPTIAPALLESLRSETTLNKKRVSQG
ncbi:MAG TPA: hypothetical protein ENJ42_07540 [Hellea balneolensis]|uniref:Uncharacterized protein n=1 Tax=Hellea balneolensis TaxID=287478 RepID=A0A7C5M0M9_9PROT|nr:hypothetical protein [Hellea balneolensis]